MKLKSRALGALVGLLAMITLGGTATAADRAYTDGPVSVVTSVRTEPGQGNAYMKDLAATYKPMMEEAKKAGHILGYAVYSTQPRGPDDPNMYLVVTYKNMAAMDGLDDRMEPIMQRSFGDDAARSKAAIDREKMRRPLGQEMIREVGNEMLEILGYQGVFASDGAEAIEIFQKAVEEGNQFDAVILDLTTPAGLGGVETIRRLLP